MSSSGPLHLSRILSEFCTLRGVARVQSDSQLSQAWQAVCGPATAAATRVQGLKRGVLNVNVASAAQLSELAAFRKVELLGELGRRYPDLKIRDLKFRLDGSLRPPKKPSGS